MKQARTHAHTHLLAVEALHAVDDGRLVTVNARMPAAQGGCSTRTPSQQPENVDAARRHIRRSNGFLLVLCPLLADARSAQPAGVRRVQLVLELAHANALCVCVLQTPGREGEGGRERARERAREREKERERERERERGRERERARERASERREGREGGRKRKALNTMGATEHHRGQTRCSHTWRHPMHSSSAPPMAIGMSHP